MQTGLLLTNIAFVGALARALAVKARLVWPSCRRWGLPMERRAVGERICGCARG